MKKLSRILMTVCLFVTCFTVRVLADGPEDVTFTSDGNGTTNVINEFVEYNNITIQTDTEVLITSSGVLVVGGTLTFEGTGMITTEEGAHIVFNDVSQAPNEITLFDHWGNDFPEPISGFMEFEYVVDKWMQFFASPEFVSANNETDVNKIDGFIEYVDVTIQTGAIVVITEGSVLAVHGTFTNNGTLNPSNGAHIVFDNVETATGITIFDSEGNTYGEAPSGFKEFEFNDGKWKEFVPPIECTYAVNYDTSHGEVWHYEGEVFTKIDPSSGPYEYNVAGEDKLYIRSNLGWVYDHVEAEGDDPENPGASIINKDDPYDEEVESINYKVVRITPNPKDNNFYYFEVKFAESPDVALANKLNTLELAFDSTLGAQDDYAKLKEYIANQIYEKYLNTGSRYHIENTVFEGNDFDTFKGKVDVITDSTEPTKTPAQIDGADAQYFKFKLDGLDGFVGIVYKLNGTDQFVLRDGNTYTIIDVGDEGKEASDGHEAAALKDFDAVKGGKIVVRNINNTVNREESEDGSNYEIFGNYAGFPMNYTGWMQDSQDTHYISIEHVMPCARGDINISSFNVGCEMILYANNFLGVCVKSSEKAKAWSRNNLPIYPTNSGEEEATVFFASEFIEISSPYDAPANSTITNVTFDGGSTSWKDCTITNNSGVFTVAFGSIFYDKVPLRITYSNGTTKSFVVARTGLSIGDYPAPGGSNSVDVCGQTVNFSDENRWLIAAQYYYDSASPSDSDRVSLFVKITKNDGTVETKLVLNTINNSGIQEDTEDVDGYTYKKYDVFELWRGNVNNRPQKIEVIAFKKGSIGSDRFGGVKLGSGNGVKWTQERGRQ